MFTIIETNGRFYLWYNGLDDIARLVCDFDSNDQASEAQLCYCPPVFDEDFV